MVDSRPGVCLADWCPLSQHDTDALIRAELLSGPFMPFDLALAADELVKWNEWYREIRELVAPLSVSFEHARRVHKATRDHFRQRGGVDSDPMVAHLAERAWGPRDLDHFTLCRVERGDEVVELPDGSVASLRPRESPLILACGVALDAAAYGESVEIQSYGPRGGAQLARVGARPRHRPWSR